MFKVGDIVICIDSSGISSDKYSPVPIENEYYTVRWVGTGTNMTNFTRGATLSLNEIKGAPAAGNTEWRLCQGRFRKAESLHDEKVLVQSLQESR